MKTKTAIFLAIILLLTVVTANAKVSKTIVTSGVILGVKGDSLVVKGLFPKSPAASAGVKLGDIIEEIDLGWGFVKAKTKHGSNIQKKMDNPSTTRVGLKVKRRGLVKTFSFKPKSMEVTYSSAPKSRIRKGRITQMYGTSGMANYTKRDGLESGDWFFVFKGTKYLGNANMRQPKSDSSMIYFTPIDSSIKKEEALGATLIFCKSSTVHFVRVANRHDIRRTSAYLQVKKRGYKLFKGARITSLDRGGNVINAMRSGRGGGAPVHYPGETIKIPIKSFHEAKAFTCSSKTRYLPKDGKKDIKKNCKVDVFYREKNGKDQAYVIVIIDD